MTYSSRIRMITQEGKCANSMRSEEPNGMLLLLKLRCCSSINGMLENVKKGDR
jgi:hypothetical protein